MMKFTTAILCSCLLMLSCGKDHNNPLLTGGIDSANPAKPHITLYIDNVLYYFDQPIAAYMMDSVYHMQSTNSFNDWIEINYRIDSISFNTVRLPIYRLKINLRRDGRDVPVIPELPEGWIDKDSAQRLQGHVWGNLSTFVQGNKPTYSLKFQAIKYHQY